MARFRGTIHGGRGEASRLGHHFLTTETNGWEAGVKIEAGKGENGAGSKRDIFDIVITSGSSPRGLRFDLGRVERLDVNGEEVFRITDPNGEILREFMVPTRRQIVEVTETETR